MVLGFWATELSLRHPDKNTRDEAIAINKKIVTNQWVKKLTLLTVFCRNEQGDFREIFELFKI
jgi:hypothetical protein